MAGRPKNTGGQAEELTPEQIKRIDKCLTGTRHELRNRAIFYMGLGSGMRIDEIMSLKIQDVAPHGALLSRIVLEKHSTKGKKSRTVAVNKKALQHLKTYLDSRTDEFLGPDTPVFPGRKEGSCMSTAWAIQVFGKMLKNAGVANASSHSLRRTHANSLRRNGVDLMIIKEQLGHSSLSTTQRYFRADPIEVQKAVDMLKI